MRKVLILTLLALVAVSCVSKKRLTYLQQSDENADSTVYQLQRNKYNVQPNDILNINVRSFDKETSELFNSSQTQSMNMNAGDLIFYLTGYTVDLNGDIDMPILGKINVAGSNTDEIKTLVEAELNNYFRDNAVYVTVQLAGVRYSVIGDAARPGKYVIYQNQVNIFEALAMAGDITMVGDRREIEIVRQIGTGVEILTLDLTNSEVLSNPDFFIQPNDIINVKPLGVKSFGIGTTGFQSFAAVLGVLASTATLIFTLSQLSK
ncbi:polysaccharide biosynthesis/export family protein [Owenweeksia hongkongensis]|uniref:polysaccharide biosynthesis/export family protein n=1 Tax=Owenweeksia hongkongensis TaxID=253245 RepID=UPI003A8F94A2